MVTAPKCTVFKDLFAKEPHHITVDAALERIKSGKSRQKIEEIRATIDKEKAGSLKCKLPSVCFSGMFDERADGKIKAHSGFIVLDFDDVRDIGEKMAALAGHDFVYAAWLSPRGNGIKALVRVADGKQHRLHFAALKEVFPEIDKSGVNESRACFESYDPNIYTNPNAAPFKKVKITERVAGRESNTDDRETFLKLLKWLSNKNEAFVTGERNLFIFKLASACCRFGMPIEAAEMLILGQYPSSNDFAHNEAIKSIKSAFKSNLKKEASAHFEKDVLVDRVTRREITVDEVLVDIDERPRDVVYGSDVKGDALGIYRNGYEQVKGLGIPELDKHYKEKPGEVTCLTGVANFGKSQFRKYYKLMKVLLYGEKFASFSPEDNPPEEYYHDFVEMYLGCDCTPNNPQRPSEAVYSAAYDFISSYIFYIYPKDLTPTPEYIKEKFLELIIKEKISGADIDPFNQLSHNYSSSGGRTDLYLETVLGDFTRFAQSNNIPITIVSHPSNLETDANGDFKCPTINKLSGGAMWGNKMDNVLVYHRPFGGSDPDNPMCELHSKKIKRQKIVGKRGFFEFRFSRKTRRFEFGGIDYMQRAIDAKGNKQNKVFQQHIFDDDAPF